jgi:hypothetical protein
MQDDFPAQQREMKLRSMNDFWKDYLRQVFWPPLWHALALTDTLVIGVFIVSGIITGGLGFFG